MLAINDLDLDYLDSLGCPVGELGLDYVVRYVHLRMVLYALANVLVYVYLCVGVIWYDYDYLANVTSRAVLLVEF